MKKQEKKNPIYNLIKEHIYSNLKQYIIVSIFFIVGIVIGIILVNNSKAEENAQIGDTITNFLEALKTDYQIDTVSLLKTVIGNHIAYTFFMWFMGCTIIGIPIVYALIVFKGFSFGYTIASAIYALGIEKGSIFCIITLFLHNLLIIPCILALAVSGVKLYETIMKDKKREKIKIEILRHTIFCIFILLILLLASFIEVYISNFILKLCVSYF